MVVSDLIVRKSCAPLLQNVLSIFLFFSPYAEAIERRLQKISLLTHIVLLKEEAHVVPCVEDLTARGVLYAVIITRQNEQHASCTLRLLYGVPQGKSRLNSILLTEANISNIFKNLTASMQRDQIYMLIS